MAVSDMENGMSRASRKYKQEIKESNKNWIYPLGRNFQTLKAYRAECRAVHWSERHSRRVEKVYRSKWVANARRMREYFKRLGE